MAGFGNLVQKAFYLGVGIASYAGEKAGGAFGDLRNQAQKLVDELVARGELTTEEAQKMMNEMLARAEASAAAEVKHTQPEGPREIQILDEGDAPTAEERKAQALRQEVEALRAELDQLKDG